MDIVRGENCIFTFPLLDVNGDPLVVSTLQRLSIQLIQHDRMKFEATLYPTPPIVQTEIRINPDANTSVDFELTQAVSARLKEGELFAKIFMGNPDADFTVDGEYLDIDRIKIADMV